jgi:alkane 1-monooxygenase
MASLRYLLPFAFLALVPLGGLLGGGWAFLGAVMIPVCLAGFDAALGEAEVAKRSATGSALRWLPAIYLVAQLAVTAWAAARVANPATGLVDAAGLAVSAGLTTGVFGFVSVHAMIHSRDRRERALGLIFLGSVFYMHFRIAHVEGHHRRAATLADPATARLGEGLYAFLARSMAGQFREAWDFAAQRRRNRMIVYILSEVAFAVGLGLISGRALIFILAVAVSAVALLETFNYVAHYGLSRRLVRAGVFERLGPQHSWNSMRRMNNAALFNMGRHSDHHRTMTRTYQQLRALEGEAELPSGYAAAMLLALLPPLWRRVMDPRARAAMARRVKTPAARRAPVSGPAIEESRAAASGPAPRGSGGRAVL